MPKKNTDTTKANQMDIAMNLYLSGRMTQRAIADLVGINENTLKNWIDKNKWDIARGALESSRGSILANLLREMNTITSQTGFSADNVAKLSKAIESFSPNKLSISGQIETVHLFTAFLYERNHSLAKELAPLAKDFIENRVKNALSAK